MHIAIDDPQAGFGGRFLVKNRAVDDITHAILLGSSLRGVQRRSNPVLLCCSGLLRRKSSSQ
jgi:hypothetical protein